MNNRHVCTCPDCGMVRIGIHNFFAMAQQITYCIVTSKYDDNAGSFVDEWHKDKLYDLSKKEDLKSLAVALLNFNVQGFKTSLKTWIERESLTFNSQDLGIQ